ncbi:MAG: hypothetical protein KatS3mg018_0918 [Fimbriimonadales bacterium]|nr:MAG: hypothetical protein KatS3mg018_0918 [Fimbriimonadales bacterium]
MTERPPIGCLLLAAWVFWIIVCLCGAPFLQSLTESLNRGRAVPDPVYENAPPEQARGPWR